MRGGKGGGVFKRAPTSRLEREGREVLYKF